MIFICLTTVLFPDSPAPEGGRGREGGREREGEEDGERCLLLQLLPTHLCPITEQGTSIYRTAVYTDFKYLVQLSSQEAHYSSLSYHVSYTIYTFKAHCSGTTKNYLIFPRKRAAYMHNRTL